MKPHIFIRTYKGDREWLPYLFRSIAKHAPEIGVTVVAPKGHDIGYPYEEADSVHPDGYIDQQYSKLTADFHVPLNTTHVIHLDSDCILTAPIDGLFVEDKSIMLHTPWDQVGEAAAWKKPTEDLLGFEAPFEFMRRQPLVYPIEAYSSLRTHLHSTHSKNLSWLISDVKGRNLSEFNLLGAFCWKYLHEDFHWIDTTNEPLPPLVARQGWSWGGVEKVKDEWEALLA